MLYTSMLSAQFLVIFVQIIYNLVDRVGIEPTSVVFQTTTLTMSVTCPYLVHPDRIALSTFSMSTRCSPTELRMHVWCSVRDSDPQPQSCKDCSLPVDVTKHVWLKGRESNPHPLVPGQ